MKVTFEVDSHEDEGRFELLANAPKLHAAVSAFLYHTRQMLKYEDRPDAEQKLIQELRDLVHEELDGYSV